MEKPLVSILVPIYGVEKYIDNCAISLFEQDYDNLEYVFVDDLSPDNSVKRLQQICENYPNRSQRVKIVRHNANRGLAAARLSGLENATGDYVMFVDSDDFIEVNTISKCIESAKSNNSDLVVIGFYHVYPKRKTVAIPSLCLTPHDYLIKALERKVNVNMCGNLFRREVFTNSGVSFVEGINSGEDYVVGSRLLFSIKKISFIYEPLYNYIHYNQGSFTNNFKKSHLNQLLRAESIIADFYKDKDEDLIFSQKVGRVKLKIEMLNMLLMQQSYDLDLYNVIIGLFPNDCNDKNIITQLGLQDKISLFLLKTKNRIILTYYVRLGLKIKQLIK